MCGRYAQSLRPSQLRAVLEDEGMPVAEAPPDEGPTAPRQLYNFAPGNHGVVYRAEIPGRETAHRPQEKQNMGDGDAPLTSQSQRDSTIGANEQNDVKYILQSMQWGLVPFWTKRNPAYSSMLKTINCRDDSLAVAGGMWATMKARKRCIVVAQGFYEWLKSGKEKIPHYVKRKDGKPMCFAGLWDCVQYEGSEEKRYTYTIITTDSNEQLKFLHDRMPVILEAGSENIRFWLDPRRVEWSRDLQVLLKPFSGELECYPVTKDVGKVGNNSPSFIIPVASKENKSNIANFFANATQKANGVSAGEKHDSSVQLGQDSPLINPDTKDDTKDVGSKTGAKRQAPSSLSESQPSPKKHVRRTAHSDGDKHKISATSNTSRSAGKADTSGTPKITKFFANCAPNL